MNFYTFAIPAKINAEQLQQELGATDIYIRDGMLVIAGDMTEKQAADGLAAHVPQLTQTEIDATNNAKMKANIGAKMASVTYIPLTLEETAWLGKQLS
jgi:hypothetical protein